MHRGDREDSGLWKKRGFHENRNNNDTRRSSANHRWQMALRKQRTFPRQTRVQASGSGLPTLCGPLDVLSQRTASLSGLCLSSLCSEYPAECLPRRMARYVFVAVALKPELISFYLLAEFMLDKNQDSANRRFSYSTFFILRSLYNCLTLKTSPG